VNLLLILAGVGGVLVVLWYLTVRWSEAEVSANKEGGDFFATIPSDNTIMRFLYFCRKTVFG